MIFDFSTHSSAQVRKLWFMFLIEWENKIACIFHLKPLDLAFKLAVIISEALHEFIWRCKHLVANIVSLQETQIKCLVLFNVNAGCQEQMMCNLVARYKSDKIIIECIRHSSLLSILPLHIYVIKSFHFIQTWDTVYQRLQVGWLTLEIDRPCKMFDHVTQSWA